MELVEARILPACWRPVRCRSPTPWSIALQIAAGLDAAPERGIVHPDLTAVEDQGRHDGTVKVLDFGLSKALEPASSGGGALSTVTTAALSGLGVTLGTAANMSPEQARGRPVDKRADISAFSCVLHEMVTRRRPFDGETVTDAIAAALERTPAGAGCPRRRRRTSAACWDAAWNVPPAKDPGG